MASVNIDGIMSLVKSWAKTSSGKKTMEEAIEEMRKSGREKTAGGSALMTVERMHAVAEELINDLRDRAMMYEMEQLLPPTITVLFDSLRYSTAYEQNNGEYNYRIDVWFDTDLSRTSLYNIDPETGIKRYTGDGVDNIINLFDKGYSAAHTAYGYWESAGKYTVSRMNRPRLGFMEEAIDFFNSTKGKDYKCFAKLLWEDGE